MVGRGVGHLGGIFGQTRIPDEIGTSRYVCGLQFLWMADDPLAICKVNAGAIIQYLTLGSDMSPPCRSS